MSEPKTTLLSVRVRGEAHLIETGKLTDKQYEKALSLGVSAMLRYNLLKLEQILAPKLTRG